jgi:hypothetical protein
MITAALLLAAGALGQATDASTVAIPSPDVQIAAAVLAAPADRRAGAAVLGYDAKGALVTLRAGTNDIVCLADDPKVPSLSVACYHKDLEPFMARGRELAAKGVKGEEREAARWKEIEAGTLKMPKEPRTLAVLTGKEFDAATGQVTDAYTRWVVYTPYATPETTGLSLSPVPGGPWLMFPGKPSAHIMISPLRAETK